MQKAIVKFNLEFQDTRIVYLMLMSIQSNIIPT